METKEFYGKQVKMELAVESRYQRELAEKEKEDAQQELVCDRTTDFVTDLCTALGWEDTYENREKIAEMIQKTF